MTAENQTSRFQRPLKQWIKCCAWSLIYILFIVWVGNYWWLFGLPVIFDLFITAFVPWTWWKKTKNKTLLSFCGWVDAILFALIAVYFINTYLFQNYEIPSSSLEKSLLVGDFLLVSKASYGPRVPNTPLSFPLVQHTFPLLNCKSFIEHPQWDYHRLKGFDNIKRNDIVVFNFPTGDTVALRLTNPDYYTLCHDYGRDVVYNRKDIFGDIVYRPVDRRENFVKRCAAVAGDWLQIKNNQVFVNGNKQEKIPGIQFNYFVQTDGTRLTDELLNKLNVSVDDRAIVSNEVSLDENKSLGLNVELPVYHFPLNEDAYTKLIKIPGITKVVIEPANCIVQPVQISGGFNLVKVTSGNNEVFPLGGRKSWTRDNYGPLWVPKK